MMRRWLDFLVHAEALGMAPGAYLTALKWRVLGKRVRARAQFAPLLGRTPHAYDRWIVGQRSHRAASPAGEPAIIALVDHTGDDAAMMATLRSLAAEQVQAIRIGPEVSQDLIRAVAGIAWAAKPWLLPMTAGDILAAGAVRAYREAGRGRDCSAIFADDDIVTAGGRHQAPHFKPDWNPELFRHHDYLTGACVVRAGPETLRTAAAQGAGWGARLVAAAVAAGGEVVHLRQVLHHRRFRPAPRLPLAAVPVAPALPRLTAIIPTRNRVDLLSTCIAGLEAADYPDLEVIVVDNDSDDPETLAFLRTLPGRSRPGIVLRLLRHEGPFNYAAINNRAIAEASGELLCLLNNDVAMGRSDWLRIMATQALREEVGAVGAQLLYPDGRLQHAGVVVGVGNAAGHAHRFIQPDEEGYFRRHQLPQFVTAVTAACLVVRRDRFLAVGGLDADAFPVAFNDVDLCLKLNARGWQSFYEPRAVLVHHESVSRGFDRDPVGAARFAGELAALQGRWHTDRIVDPFHHPQLSRASEQFTLAL